MKRSSVRNGNRWILIFLKATAVIWIALFIFFNVWPHYWTVVPGIGAWEHYGLPLHAIEIQVEPPPWRISKISPLAWFVDLLVGLGPPAICWLLSRRLRYERGKCKRCSYDLTGNTSGACSECGAVISLAK